MQDLCRHRLEFSILFPSMTPYFVQMMTRYIVALAAVLAVIYAQQTETDTVAQNQPQETLAAPVAETEVDLTGKLQLLPEYTEAVEVGKIRNKRAPLIGKALVGGALLGAGALGAGALGAGVVGAGLLGAKALGAAALYKGQ